MSGPRWPHDRHARRPPRRSTASALIVTYGPPSRRLWILIDGGPAPKYEKGLRAHLLSLPESQRRFDLAIVTHIDADHIDGMLKLLQDEALGLKVREIWFNRWPQISATPIPGARPATEDRSRASS